jgi:cytochrome c peroxidase
MKRRIPVNKVSYVMIAIALSLVVMILARQPLASAQNPTTEDMVALGKLLFFDENLSANRTQSCATCHAPEVGWTGPDSAINAAGSIYEGAIPGRLGNRRPPTSAYAGDSPILNYDEDDGAWFGGMFWDGRATGLILGDPLAEQAQGPYLNPLEQALPNAQTLCVRVKNSDYADLFEAVWGASSLDCAKDADGVYEKIGRAVAAYERSPEVNPYNSKFDLFWDNAAAAGKDVSLIECDTDDETGCSGDGTNGWWSYRNLGLTDTELRGLAVFNDPNRGDCSSCHAMDAGSSGYPVFSDFEFYNVGFPKNPANPFYSMPKRWNPDGKDWVDYGLGDFLKSAGYPAEVYESELGRFKTPTLRNVDLRPSADFVKAYGHNGYFKSLDDIVLFYHWRAVMDSGGIGDSDMTPDMFPPPEVDQNRVMFEVFPRSEVDNIVAFLKTLSDGFQE